MQLKISRLIYDAEVENEEIYGLLLYDPLKNQMKIKRIHERDGNLNEQILSSTGTSPSNIEFVKGQGIYNLLEPKTILKGGFYLMLII